MKQKIIQTIKNIEKNIEELKDLLNDNIKEEPKQFQPTEEQIERWKQMPPTKKTLGLLSTKGFGAEEIKEIKTQYAANIILNSLKKENI